MKFPLFAQDAAGLKEAVFRGKAATPVCPKTDQNFASIVVGALGVEVVQKLGNSGALGVGVELEVDVVDEMAVLPPQSEIVWADGIIFIWGYGSERDDLILFEVEEKSPETLCECVGICTEVFIIYVYSV